MDTNTENNNVQTTPPKESMVKTFKEANYLYFAYYVLSFLLLFLRIFAVKTEGMSIVTGISGFKYFADGIGWFYYIATAIGLLSVFLKPLHFMEKLGAKVISVINFVVTLVLLLTLIPSSLKSGASITMSLWIILVFHGIAVLGFWFQFIQAHRNKNKNK